MFDINLIFLRSKSRMFQLPQFVWALRSSVWDVVINFLVKDATYRNKISSDQKRFFIALSLYPLSFFANTPFKAKKIWIVKVTIFSRQNFSTSLQSYKPPLELPQWVQHRFTLFGNQKKHLFIYTHTLAWRELCVTIVSVEVYFRYWRIHNIA